MSQNERIHVEHYFSMTPGNKPAVADLHNGEIAVNVPDELLFTKNKNKIVTYSSDEKLIQKMACENITYSALKTLRDTKKLVPGKMYRITDYVTTTIQWSTISAGHAFDIIVTALSENTLSEEASAIKHEGDNYFRGANMSAWKLWYCLDNDIVRFQWADIDNGKGVIYRMIDEHNNDCPYDFKNIKFEESLFNGVASNDGYLYTFSYTEDGMGQNYDASLTQYIYEDTFYGTESINERVPILVDNNKIGNYYELYDHLYTENLIPFVVFFIKDTTRNNIIGRRCDSVLLLGGSNNIIGNSCNNVTLNNCYNIVIGNYCYGANIGVGGNNIRIGERCDDIIMGDYCSNIIIGNDCKVQFVNSGNIARNYCRNNVIADGCNVKLINNTTTNSLVATHLKNYFIKTSGTIDLEITGADYEIRVEKNSKGEIKQYCLADLIG